MDSEREPEKITCEQGILTCPSNDDLGLCPYCTPDKNTVFIGRVENHEERREKVR